MRLSRKASALAVAALAPLGVAVSAGPANAVGPTQDFFVCKDMTGSCHPTDYTYGTITWNTLGQPTVAGSVFKPANTSYIVQAVFDAFTAGSTTRVESQGRTVSGTATKRGFSFPSGLTYRIDRIRVTVCIYATSTSTPVCGPYVSYYRPS